ncbi:LCP family protein [Nonomuraea endophytica]|uniref:LCP family protein required for cell wall assembly n=1 Tax=Nonomuraea endophytica TaxID=714136 RepID=A0A7W7ZXE1_9ACTN|nr:LCP family protein [Nonomuraea endophytica]MBB5075542.1 LCP family protein required for cell wall assembly [Nonomuraea endophytica]
MDDLKLLRDFGRELEQEPPATLVRQRRRYMGTAPRRRGRAGWAMMGAVAVATALAVAVPTLLLSNRDRALPMGSGDRPVNVSGVRNILLIGSDTREGPGNEDYGPREARQGSKARADTIALVHLPADRGKPTVVSVPRDSLVQIAACEGSPARRDMINAAYTTGGVECLVKTLEKLTGVRVDHYAEVDFSGFKKVVDALGGVEVTIKQPIEDPKAKLSLPGGRSTLDGEKALGYFRLRHTGDGSDVQRIKRQQSLLYAMLAKAKTALVTNPAGFREFLGAVTAATTTDLNVEEMYQLATSLRKSKPVFVTVPWAPAPDDPNRLVWKQPEAKELFAKLR